MHPDPYSRSDERIDDIRALLASLDHPTPAVSAAAIAAAARARAQTRRDRRRTAVRWAAAILLTVGAAGAAVAAPGSPVLGWITRVVVELRGGHQPVPPQVPQATPTAAEPAGIAVAPGDGLTIVFAAAAGGVVSVSLGRSEEVTVRARAGGAHFASEPDRLLVEVSGAADTIGIEVPRTAPRVELRAKDLRLLVVERGRVQPASVPDALGHYSVVLPPAR